jgi:hypothetical protein
VSHSGGWTIALRRILFIWQTHRASRSAFASKSAIILDTSGNSWFFVATSSTLSTSFLSILRQLVLSLTMADLDAIALNNEVVKIHYPVVEYPSKVTSLNLDKTSEISGVLQGIKGQYLQKLWLHLVGLVLRQTLHTLILMEWSVCGAAIHTVILLPAGSHA